MSFAVLVAAVLGVLAGCGGHAVQPNTSNTHTMSEGATMSAKEMAGMSGTGTGAGTGDLNSQPSIKASMICGGEIQQATRRLFALPAVPPSAHTWSNKVFTCTYRVPAGVLRLSVKDLTASKPGRAYFEKLRSDLGSPKLLSGLQNLGFPAFVTTNGSATFFKDGKTLHVDATALDAARLPAHYSRQDVAYSIASNVIACWTE